MSLAMVMSWSRGGWVGLAAALVVITVVRSRKALVSAVAIALLMGYLLLAGGGRYLPPAVVQRVADFVPYLGGVDVVSVAVTDANWAVVERMAHWLAAVGMFTDHPWLGVGIGNYPVAYPQYALGRWRDPLGHAHNYYLNIAAEAGIIGLGAYLLLFTACFVQAWRVIQRTQGYWRAVALGALGVLVHLSVHNLFDNLYVHSMNVQLGLFLGMLFLAEKSGDVEHAHRH
jgi:O-antigen ligase